jgi:hypothetical protein
MTTRKGPARSSERERFWRRVVAKQPTSGLSIRDWCGSQGVSEPSFYAWRLELARRAAERIKANSAGSAPVRFVELELREAPPKSSFVAALPPASADAALRIVVGDVRVEVAPGFDGPTLRQLLDVLRGMAGDGDASC